MPIVIKMSERFPLSLPSGNRRRLEISRAERVAEIDRLNVLSEDFDRKFPSSDLDERIVNLSLEDFSNDMRIWHRAFHDLNVAGGGTIFFDVYGESSISPLDGLNTIVIPRVSFLRDDAGNLVERNGRPREQGWRVVFEGLSRSSCQIVGRGFDPTQPIFEWENSIADTSSTETIKRDLNNATVDQFIWRNMTIRHTEGGTAIRHTISQEIEDRVCRDPDRVPGCITFSETKQELRNCTFSNLRLASDDKNDLETAIFDMKGAKFSVFRDLIFEGAGQKKTGFRLAGVRNIVETLYSPQKTNAPGTFLDFKSSNSILSHARTEGGSSKNADYYIHDCQNVDIQNLLSEGVLSQNIVLIKNCQNVTLRTIVTATLIDNGTPEQNGLRFVDSQYCTVMGSTLSAQVRSGGRALVFDVDSSHNTVLFTRIVRSRSREQVQDLGTDNRWAIVDVNRDDGGTLFLSFPSGDSGGLTM